MILVRYEHHNKSHIKLNHKTLAELFTRVSFTEFIVEGNTFEQVLSIKQLLDRTILELSKRLKKTQLPLFELHEGLVYRKHKNGKMLLFYVPHSMINNVIRNVNENYAHVGVEKTCEVILRTYWLPNMKFLVKDFISNCLNCIKFAPKRGKTEGSLHSIPKGTVPFDTHLIDHYGPLEKCKNGDKFIFLVVDAFTKFIKLYPCRDTSSSQVIKHLKNHFKLYSVPNRIISDRGSCFTSEVFQVFLLSENVKHIQIAVGCPRANGQVERFNSVVGPMLAKLNETPDRWNEVLSDIEFSINNTVSSSTGQTPSMLLYGVNQKCRNGDKIRSHLELLNEIERVDLVEMRVKAEERIEKAQECNKKYYDRVHKRPIVYDVGDKVVITNYVTEPGVNRKLLPKFKGPYMVKEVLPHDRYVVTDIEGHQVIQLPYKGTVDASHMKLWLSDQTF